MAETILLVEDEPRIVRLVGEVLKAVGYRMIIASAGEEAIGMVALEQPDLVLLDLMLPPGPDGYEVCQRLREFTDVPIIMLTARATESDILRGFDVGADDYLTKPFSSRELVARVRAVLRRAARPEELVSSTFTCGDLRIRFASHRVLVQGQLVKLTRTEFALLRELALNANRVMVHQELLSRVWGPEYLNDVDYLRAYIYHLRRKLEPTPADPQLLITMPGVGYMLVCPGGESGAAPP